MSMIDINGRNYRYTDADVLNFIEGLIGLPKMRRAALIPLPEYEPFCWLASLGEDKTRFVVVDPRRIFSDYEPEILKELEKTGAGAGVEKIRLFAIVKISSDWRQTTVNLRSPIFFDPATGKAVQTILTESSYKPAESLPDLQKN